MDGDDIFRLQKALVCLFLYDSYLLRKNSSERSITFKLAKYLQDQYKDYDVDCEYNLRGCSR